jgi:hypothetical protein
LFFGCLTLWIGCKARLDLKFTRAWWRELLRGDGFGFEAVHE